MDGCKLRFGTQSLLARHVNHHFVEERSSNGGGGGGNDNDKDGDGGSGHAAFPSPMGAPPAAAVKVIRKAGKRLKYRRWDKSFKISVNSMPIVQIWLYYGTFLSEDNLIIGDII